MARYPWPHWPDEEEPTVGVSIRPLRADQLPPLPPPPDPVVSAPPEPVGRHTIVFGKPGASAVTQYRRRRAAEWADYRRTLFLRLAARRLRRLGRGWTVFHDLAIPGSRANVDHLVIGPPGVFLVDSKHYRGRLTLTPEGSLWYGHHPLAGVLATVRWEAAALSQALRTTVTPIICVHGAQLPWGELMAEGIPVLAADRVTTTLHSLPPLFDNIQLMLVAAEARRQLHLAA